VSANRNPQPSPATPPSVLVVDADEDTRALYRCALESQGYHVLEACDGREALTMALVRPPAVVVTETRLAHIDGYALCEILRRDRTTTAVPIVVVSADTHAGHQQRARKTGATMVFTKPIAIDTIVAALQRLVDEASSTTISSGSPLMLRCPTCDRRLTYQRSQVGAMNASSAERWDEFSCDRCGLFQSRHRPRALKASIH
jgi:CheY-like chemotaxis protein